MKKIFLAALIIISLATCASAAIRDGHNVGVLAQLNMTEREYEAFVIDGRKNFGWNFLSSGNDSFSYYDSLLAMQLALNSREVVEVQLP